jgi:flagellar hook-associated protein 1 FlgK
MSDINGVLSIAGQALITQQQAIHVTGHNIANVNTPGYSRQKLIMAPNVAFDSVVGIMGNGVSADEIERVYDRFLTAQINNEIQVMGRWDAQKQSVESLEVIFNETYGSGLNQAMSEFWNSWQALTNNPSGPTERQILVTRGQILTTTFNKLDADLSQAQQDLDRSIVGTIEDINELSVQLANLNQKIVSFETVTQTANDYRDKRDVVLRELAELIDINAYEDNDGAVSVLIANGRPLVSGSSVWQLSTETNGAGLQDVVWVDGAGNTVNINADIAGGRLKGWLETRDSTIADLLNRLDTLAQTIMTEVNNLHQGGFDLNGIAGQLFFDGSATAAGIEVNANIIADLDLIAAASDPLTVPGDNRNAIDIANLQHQLAMSGNTATFSDYYSTLVRDVGNEVLQADSYHTHQSEMVAQLDNYRESISGVSLDEEMINLLKFQNAYAAAAKLVSASDEMIKTVIQMI